MFKSLFIAVLLLSCLAATAQTGLILNGTITGYEDSTRIILNRILNNGEADLENEQTAFLISGRFSLSDNIIALTHYSLRIRPKNISDEDFTKYENLSFWGENKSMFLTADKGAVAFAHINGSEIQDAYEKFTNLEKERKLKNKQIMDSVKMDPGITEKKKSAMRTTYQSNEFAIENANMEFIYNNPQYYFSVAGLAFRVKHYPERLEKNKVVNFYEQLSLSFKNDENGGKIKNYIENKSSSRTDIRKPHLFILPDSTGVNFSLSALKGKVVLLDFWFAGCAPCRMEHKNYLNAYKAYHDNGFEIVSVNSDAKKGVWTNAMQKDTMIWRSVWDPEKKVTEELYHIREVPSNYLINAKGIIIAKDLRGEALLSTLKNIFAKN